MSWFNFIVKLLREIKSSEDKEGDNLDESEDEKDDEVEEDTELKKER